MDGFSKTIPDLKTRAVRVEVAAPVGFRVSADLEA